MTQEIQPHIHACDLQRIFCYTFVLFIISITVPQTAVTNLQTEADHFYYVVCDRDSEDSGFCLFLFIYLPLLSIFFRNWHCTMTQTLKKQLLKSKFERVCQICACLSVQRGHSFTFPMCRG